MNARNKLKTIELMWKKKQTVVGVVPCKALSCLDKLEIHVFVCWKLITLFCSFFTRVTCIYLALETIEKLSELTTFNFLYPEKTKF